MCSCQLQGYHSWDQKDAVRWMSAAAASTDASPAGRPDKAVPGQPQRAEAQADSKNPEAAGSPAQDQVGTEQTSVARQALQYEGRSTWLKAVQGFSRSTPHSSNSCQWEVALVHAATGQHGDLLEM